MSQNQSCLSELKLMTHLYEIPPRRIDRGENDDSVLVRRFRELKDYIDCLRGIRRLNVTKWDDLISGIGEPIMIVLVNSRISGFQLAEKLKSVNKIFSELIVGASTRSITLTATEGLCHCENYCRSTDCEGCAGFTAEIATVLQKVVLEEQQPCPDGLPPNLELVSKLNGGLIYVK